MTTAEQAAYDAFILAAETARDATDPTQQASAYDNYLRAANVALKAGDQAQELLALRLAMTASGELVTASQQDGNSIDYGSARQGIQARIDRLQVQATATVGVQRTKIKPVAITD